MSERNRDREEMARSVRAEFQAEPRSLEAVRGLVRGFARSWDLPNDRIDDIVLAVNEACCNVIRHSYDSDPSRRFVLAMGVTDKYLEFELRDSGKPAPRDKVAPRRVRRPGKRDVRPGGLGVQLIYRVFDEAVFEPGRTRGNRVVMRAKRPRKKRATGSSKKTQDSLRRKQDSQP